MFFFSGIRCLGLHWLGLAVVFDLELNFRIHVGYVTKTAFYHLKNIAMVRLFLSDVFM